MSEALQVPEGHSRSVWVFGLDLPESQFDVFQAAPKDTPDAASPLAKALGVTALDRRFVEVFETDTIEEFGLARYLCEANGMSQAQVAAARTTLDAHSKGTVLVFSRALSGPVTLTPQAPLTFLGKFDTEFARHSHTKLDSKAADGTLVTPAKKTEPPRIRWGWLAAGTAVVMAVLLAIIWASA
ncbi:hypothetical protein AQS8620_00585 [Aquimixticola soesokkakensis]|uniref:Uncharacterized protein n=1 Tax=Aquimixticola soesokkakensis TaxID=1519096 RepID=A0A1Y5RPA8_9RHOB|nr:hypothetical protein [Aquimixticola soesokkakensis]SLN21150.1 hypothetical protein AQS8620_00585 [Aquimixticola soesokkakensis]